MPFVLRIVMGRGGAGITVYSLGEDRKSAKNGLPRARIAVEGAGPDSTPAAGSRQHASPLASHVRKGFLWNCRKEASTGSVKNLSNFISEVTSNSAQTARDDRPMNVSLTRLGWWPPCEVEAHGTGAVPSPPLKCRG